MREAIVHYHIEGIPAVVATELKRLRADNERLRAALRDVYEVWAGSDGFVPATAPEGYQQRLIEQMRDAASRGLSGNAGG